jgi:hypothetical protein
LLLFQEFKFEVVVKPDRHNVGPDHLSRIESREAGGSLDDELPNAQLFRVEAVPDQFMEIAAYLTIGKARRSIHRHNADNW